MCDGISYRFQHLRQVFLHALFSQGVKAQFHSFHSCTKDRAHCIVGLFLVLREVCASLYLLNQTFKGVGVGFTFLPKCVKAKRSKFSARSRTLRLWMYTRLEACEEKFPRSVWCFQFFVKLHGFACGLRQSHKVFQSSWSICLILIGERL